jgi:hypothetical protein
MSSSKIRRLEAHIKALEKRLADEKSRKPSRFSKTAGAIITVLGLLLGCAGLSVFWPRLTVDPEGEIDLKAGRAMVFKVQNTGFLTLHDVQPLLGLCQINIGSRPDPSHICPGPLGSRMIPTYMRIGTLSMDEKSSFRLDDLFNGKPPDDDFAADISAIIEYRPAVVGWMICALLPCQKEFRFQTRKELDGKLSWQARSASTALGR